jgi:peptide/nickel transport system substrate-binding protein
VIAGKASSPSGVAATRTTITFRLQEPDGGFLPLLTSLCTVPSDLPVSAEGVGAPLPSAAPYYASEYVPGRRIVLERNRFYRGPRPHHVARFDVNLQNSAAQILAHVKAGTADWGLLSTAFYGTVTKDLARRYGVNRSRFFVRHGLFLRMFVINTTSPLFRSNPRLRQAVNYAVERTALNAVRGPYTGTAIDHYLYPDLPGYRPVHVYPIRRPLLARARALARGHTRSGKAVVYISSAQTQRATALAQAQILQRDLKRIGIDVTIQAWPGSQLFERMATPGEPFDLGLVGWSGGPDPGLLDCLFNGKRIGKDDSCNWSYLDSPRYNRALDAASALSGRARARAFRRLDVRLTRDVAPAIPYAYDNGLTLVSARTGCVVLNPLLDLGAVCLKS